MCYRRQFAQLMHLAQLIMVERHLEAGGQGKLQGAVLLDHEGLEETRVQEPECLAPYHAVAALTLEQPLVDAPHFVRRRVDE